LRNIWLPVAILAIFLLISIVALAGLGRNIAQKRDAYSDPLCKAYMDKTPQAVDNMAAKNPGGQENSKEEHGMSGPERQDLSLTLSSEKMFPVNTGSSPEAVQTKV
jgi:hypothetical protein